MDWLSELRERHRSGYIEAGKCLSCRRGKDGCPGGRFRNSCPNYLDNFLTREEAVKAYTELLRKLFAAEGEPARGELYGAAQSRRSYLRERAGVREEDLRRAENALGIERTEENNRDLRRLRWEL